MHLWLVNCLFIFINRGLILTQLHMLVHFFILQVSNSSTYMKRLLIFLKFTQNLLELIIQSLFNFPFLIWMPFIFSFLYIYLFIFSNYFNICIRVLCSKKGVRSIFLHYLGNILTQRQYKQEMHTEHSKIY